MTTNFLEFATTLKYRSQVAVDRKKKLILRPQLKFILYLQQEWNR